MHVAAREVEPGAEVEENGERPSFARLMVDAAKGIASALVGSRAEPDAEAECDPESPCYSDGMARDGDLTRGEEDGRLGTSDDADGQVVRAVKRAVEQFTVLSGLDPDSLSGLRREKDGWSLLVDVVELERIPLTLSILATYRVDADRDGHLVAYERLRRFTRDATD